VKKANLTERFSFKGAIQKMRDAPGGAGYDKELHVFFAFLTRILKLLNAKIHV